MDYLGLVNKAIDEAGPELDPLTISTFASPPGAKMYSRFKTWVTDSWEELQNFKGKESFFSNAVVVTSLRPRVRVFDLEATTAVHGKQYYDADNNIIEVVAEGPALTGDKGLGTYKGFLDIAPLDNYENASLDSLWIEDTLDPNPNTFKISGFPGYKITEIDPTIKALASKPVTLKIGNKEHMVEPIEWKHWMPYVKGEYGVPRLYTMSPDGYLYFYPHLAENAVFMGFGTLKPQKLLQHDDVPVNLSDEHHMAIVWAAVMKYANYERDSRLWSTANKEFAEYFMAMQRDAGLLPRWQDSQYG